MNDRIIDPTFIYSKVKMTVLEFNEPIRKNNDKTEKLNSYMIMQLFYSVSIYVHNLNLKNKT